MTTIMGAAQREAARILARAAEEASAVLTNAARLEAHVVRREGAAAEGLLHRNPAINKKYESRLTAAQRCREILSSTEPFEFEANYGASSKRSVSRHSSELLIGMVEAVIANPDHHGKELGSAFGHGATWFNTVLREGMAASGVAQ